MNLSHQVSPLLLVIFVRAAHARTTVAAPNAPIGLTWVSAVLLEKEHTSDATTTLAPLRGCEPNWPE